jgi:RHS repeat-associated protein
LDLSGGMQGAGGVGGLLEIVFQGSVTTNCFVAFDGNGNIATLDNANDGSTGASYEYGPFGELVRVTGLVGKANPFRFSTRYQDDESELLAYPYRLYSAAIGRFLTRDPKRTPGMIDMRNSGTRTIDGGVTEDESDGNPYCFVRNNPDNGIDPLGLEFLCQSALVDIFVPKGHRFNAQEMKDELAFVVPDALGVSWAIIPGDPPAGSKLGFQGGDSSLETAQCLCIYYLKVDISKKPITVGSELGLFDTLGRAPIGEWEADGYPQQFDYDYDTARSEGSIPGSWDQKNSSDAWKQLSGFIMAHEVVHAIGGHHNGPKGTLMNRSISWAWLDAKHVPITPRTLWDIRSILLQQTISRPID